MQSRSRNKDQKDHPSKKKIKASDIEEIGSLNTPEDTRQFEGEISKTNDAIRPNDEPSKNSVSGAKLSAFASRLAPVVFAVGFVTILYMSLIVNDFNIYVNGDYVEDSSSEYYEKAKEVSGNSFLGNIKPFYRTQQLADSLSTPIIAINNIQKDTRLFSSTIDIYIIESRPSLVYEHEQTSNSYLVDSDGIAYQKLNDDQISIDSVSVIDKTPFPAGVNQTVLADSTIEFINSMNGLFNREYPATTPVSYTINSSERYLELRLASTEYYVHLATNRPVESQFLAYKDTIDHLGLNNSSKPSSHIDVRLDGQVFFK